MAYPSVSYCANTMVEAEHVDMVIDADSFIASQVGLWVKTPWHVWLIFPASGSDKKAKKTEGAIKVADHSQMPT